MIGTPLTQDTLPEARGGPVEIPTRRPARAAGSPDASYTYRLTQAVQRSTRQLRSSALSPWLWEPTSACSLIGPRVGSP